MNVANIPNNTVYFRIIMMDEIHPVLLSSGGILVGYLLQPDYYRQMFYSSQVIASRTYIGKITTSKTGEIATNNFIKGSSIKNIIAVKIFDSAGSRNVHTELYSYKTYAFIVAKNDVGDRLVNTELDIVVFYIK